jgi:PAS domain S-box-containing protein
MLLLLSIITQLRLDRVPAALDEFLAARTEIQALDAEVRALKRQHEAFASSGDVRLAAEFDAMARQAAPRSERIAQLACPGTPGAPDLRARAGELARLVAAYAVLLQPAALAVGTVPTLSLTARGDALLQDIQGRLAEQDRHAHECFRAKMDAIWANAKRTKQRAEILLLLIVGTVLAILFLRRSDQRQLRDQLTFNEQLIDALPLPLSLRSTDGRFLLVNQAFEQKHGIQRAQALGRPVAEVLPPADADAIADMDARARASAAPVEEQFHMRSPHGERHVMVRVHALRRPDDSITCTVGIQSDVTALRQHELQLMEANARLSQLAVKMIDAQENERRRIARDLHDQVGQILTALKLQLASLARRPAIEAPATAFATPIDLTEEALRHTRDLSASLHPHLLDDLGIEPALHWLIDRFIRPSLADIELRCRLAPPRGPEASELVAFRVVQEALTNVVRHAGATRVGVMLEAEDGELAIEVIDDGVGFEAGSSWSDLQRASSLGITGMRDRVIELGGTLQVDSKPGTGTSLRVRLPWRKTA